MNKKKDNIYTIMFIPKEGEGKTFKLQLHKVVVRFFLVLMLIILLCLSCLTIKTGEIALKLQLVGALHSENERLRLENEKLKSINSKVKNIERICEYLQRMANFVDNKQKIPQLAELQRKTGIEIFDKDSIDKFFEKTRLLEQKQYSQVKDEEKDPAKLMRSVPTLKPVDGWITNRFQQEVTDTASVHLGVDFAASEGAVIYATAAGVVESVTNDQYLGLLITLKHDYGYKTRYGHCSRALVAPGQQVKQGQVIALVGNTGRSSAPHLHYEVILNGKHVNPLDYIQKQ